VIFRCMNYAMAIQFPLHFNEKKIIDSYLNNNNLRLF